MKVQILVKVGNTNPFKWIGAPWIDGKLSQTLNNFKLPTLSFQKLTPIRIPGKSENPKFKGQIAMASKSGSQIAINTRALMLAY